MASPAETRPNLCAVIPACPICGGKMELTDNRFNHSVCQCADCLTFVTVPSSAWQVGKIKRETKWPKK